MGCAEMRLLQKENPNVHRSFLIHELTFWMVARDGTYIELVIVC